MSIDDADRTRMDAERLAALMAGMEPAWPAPVLLDTTGSTNDEVETLARAGAPEGTCVVADQQTAGRGRLGREWVSPPGAGLWMSVLVRPGDVPKERWGWLSLLAGVAAEDALRGTANVRAQLKWPNDIVVLPVACGGGDSGQRKLGGILSQVIDDDAIAVGIGINVAMTSAELPIPEASSVFLEGGTCDREALLAALLAALQTRLAQWRAEDPKLERAYRMSCLTIGRLVKVTMPDGHLLEGEVSGVDEAGHLKVVDGESVTIVTAGDVRHASL